MGKRAELEQNVQSSARFDQRWIDRFLHGMGRVVGGGDTLGYQRGMSPGGAWDMNGLGWWEMKQMGDDLEVVEFLIAKLQNQSTRRHGLTGVFWASQWRRDDLLNRRCGW